MAKMFLNISCGVLLAIEAMISIVPRTLAEERVSTSLNASAIEEHIQRVATGLRPTVAITGEPAMKLIDRMSDLHVPGVSIAVIHDGAVQWARGFGVTAFGGPPVTPVTLFQAASISKPVTAVAALAMVQAGKLDLDADVNLFLRSWKVPANSYTHESKVTLRELLNHSAGTTVGGFEGYQTGVTIPTLLDVLNGVLPANSAPIIVDHRPGTRYHYSSGGYSIVQQLLIDVTGKPFQSLLDETVLRPFGMMHSSFLQPLSANEANAAATPYLATGAPVPGGSHTYPELAAAGLWTTPTDIARFALALLDASAGRATPVLSQLTTRQMLTPGLGDYGLSLIIRGSAPNRCFSHGGVNKGFVSSMVAYETGEGAVIMTNGDRGGELVNEIMRSIATEYHWRDWPALERKRIAINSKLLEQFAGDYQLAPNMIMHISSEGGHLFAQRTGHERFEIFPDSDRELFYTGEDTLITFDTDGQRHPTQMIFHQNGEDIIGKRVQ